MTADAVLRMQRHFDTTPERLYAAWTDPERASHWLFTGPESEVHQTRLDVRVGGGWEIVDRRGGTDYRAIGEYLEVDPPRRLAFSFGMPQFSPEFTKVTVEITPDGAGAMMTLTQENLLAEHVEGLREGWRRMFEGLAAQLAPVG